METRYALATEKTQEFVGNYWKLMLKTKRFPKKIVPLLSNCN